MYKIKAFLKDNLDKLQIMRMRQAEKRKFQDARRKKITESVILTSEQMKAIDDVFLPNYGEKIPYTWHRHYTAFTGQFDPRYFPELIYIPEFERFENLWPEYDKVFADKNVLPIFAKHCGVLMPYSYLSCTKKLLKDGEDNVLSFSDALLLVKNLGEVFIKPTVDSDSGEGCFAARFVNGIDEISHKDIATLLLEQGDDYVVQEKIKCHRSISNIYPQSVNTFRIMTYRWKDDIKIAPISFRFGSGGSIVDNIHAGGYCISVNDDGVLHREAYTEFAKRITEHPDTHVVFEGYRIAHFETMRQAAIKMHAQFPQLGLVQWDFTVNQDGKAVLIEANTRGTSIQLIERCLGRGPFGEHTEEILRWMRFMKHTKASERYKYAFGNMPSDLKKIRNNVLLQ